LSNAEGALSAAPASRRWVVPALGSTTAPALSGIAPAHLDLTNLSGRRETYVVQVMVPTGFDTVGSGDLAASASVSLHGRILALAGLNPLIVHTNGRAAVSEDVGPTGGYGVVTMPAMPLAGAAGD
jgi:hypothetical protein